MASYRCRPAFQDVGERGEEHSLDNISEKPFVLVQFADFFNHC